MPVLEPERAMWLGLSIWEIPSPGLHLTPRRRGSCWCLHLPTDSPSGQNALRFPHTNTRARASPVHTRRSCPTAAAKSPSLAFRGNRRAPVPPTDAARSRAAGRPHPRARSGGRGAALLRAGGFPGPARTPHSLPTLPRPPPGTPAPAPPRARRRVGWRGGERPGRHPATLVYLTTGAAHTHRGPRGLRPTQAWLLPGAAPA